MKFAYLAFVLVTSAFVAKGQDPITLKAGTYRGLMTIKSIIDGAGQSTASMKLIGHSAGDDELKFMGVPQFGSQLFSYSKSSAATPLFKLTASTKFLSYLSNSDGGVPGFSLLSLSVKKDVVRAETNYVSGLPDGSNMTYELKIHLTRVGK